MRNQLIRQLQIDLITDTPNPIIDWFNDLWSKMHIIETDVYHNDGGELIYYIDIHDIKQWIFFQDNKYDIFWCNYGNYWSILSNKFSLNFTDKQSITKFLVENSLNNNTATPDATTPTAPTKIENALNNNTATPYTWKTNEPNDVEHALNKI